MWNNSPVLEEEEEEEEEEEVGQSQLSLKVGIRCPPRSFKEPMRN